MSATKTKIGQCQKPAAIKRFSAIEHILKILTVEQESETAIQLTLNYLIKDLKIADIGIVWRYEDPGYLVARKAFGININNLKTLKVSSIEGLIGKAFQSGNSTVFPGNKNISDFQDADRVIFGKKVHGLDRLISAACLPLTTDNAKYGVLMFLNLQNEDRFNRSNRLFFRAIAMLLIMTMEKVNLTNELKNKEISDSINRYKAALIPTLAHEMRTPLISIKGYSTALLMEDAVFTPEKHREFLEIINRESDTLEGLISDYLESSTIDAGMMKINLQPVRLPRLAIKAAGEIGRHFPKHSLIVDFPSEFPLIDADPERIMQVLRQLLDNAAKYSLEGGMIVLRGIIDVNKVVVSVADEGVGIAPEDLNHLFDRFFRVKSNSGSQILGTGLGLPISKAIVEAHGGTIWAESQLGQGSQFYFSLPLKAPDLNHLE